MARPTKLQVRERETVNPNMVILGRDSRRLTQKDLAKLLGISQGRISKMEMGLLPIPNDVLDNLVRQLKYPRHFFFQEGSIRGVGVPELFHRRRQAVPKRLLDKIYALIEIQSAHHIPALLQAVEVPCSFPILDADEYNGKVERIANLVRERWQLPRGPIQDLTEAIEDAGGIVIPFRFETQLVDAISRWIPGMPPLFFVNVESPKDRLRFSLAHEVGHLVMHALPNGEIEDQADRFAAEFLLPQRDIRPDLHDISLSRLAVLKQYWKASMAAILKRAQDLGAITASEARHLWVLMAKAGYKTREPVELDIQGETPRTLQELIEIHQEQLGYSLGDLAQTLALEEEEVLAAYLSHQPQRHLKLVLNPSRGLGAV